MVSRLEALMSGDVGGALKQYNVSAFVCVRLQLVDDSGEAATAQFAPGYVHQLCGESESISGYSKPSVVLYLHKRSFKAMLSFDYEEKRSVNGSKPSDVPALFHEWMPQGFAHCQPELARLLSHDDGASLPEHCASSSRSVPLKNSEHGRTLALPFSEAAVRHWFERLEILSILFIDGARMLEGADHNWEIIALLVPDSNDEALAGFAAVHSFYAWPDRRRIRIAQLAVLPPFRNRGIASALLEEIRMLSLDRRYVDMTFEDPSDQLLTIRGTLDVTKMLSDGGEWIRERARAAVDDALSASSHQEQVVSLRMPSSLIAEGQKRFCVCSKQMHRCWESLLYNEAEQRGVKTAQRAYSAFKEVIRKRLETGVADEVKEDAQHKHLIDTDTGFVMSKNKGLVGMIMEQFNAKAIDFNDEEMQDADQQAQKEHEQAVQDSINYAVSVARRARERVYGQFHSS